MNHKRSILGGLIAFVVATSCCWLPALIIAIGGGGTLIGLSYSLEKFSGVFFITGIALLGYGIYQYQKQIGKQSSNSNPILKSILTCPECGNKKEEIMPTNACQYFYECENCKNVLKPAAGDCCVYCSFGSVPCPPIQLNQDCC